MKSQLNLLIKILLASQNLNNVEDDLSIPEHPSQGDYTSKVAFVLSKSLKRPPYDIAISLKDQLVAWKQLVEAKTQHQDTAQTDQFISKNLPILSVLQDIDHIEVVRPGYLNLFLTEAKLITHLTELLNVKQSVHSVPNVIARTPASGGGTKQSRQGRDTSLAMTKKRIMVEFAHPNTHKAFHIGHLRNITTGESIVRLLETTGHEVIRANYQGDVGMHIAKAIYALLQMPEFKDQISVIRKKDIHQKVEFLGLAYAAGSKAFDEDKEAAKAIGEINKQIYAKDTAVYQIYQETRQWSLDYFAGIYKRVGSHFDRYYFESETYATGKEHVLDGLKKGIFVKSESAVIFPGEKFGLHNRVFITGEGNATYEGKDMGLGRLQFDEYHPDLVLHVLGPEQWSYTQVMFEALAQLFPDTRGQQYHLVYGWVKLKHGKMSSRSGNVVLGEWLLDEAKKAIYNILQKSKSKYSKTDRENIAETAAVAAVKYSFLKVGTNQEIAFDLKESVSFEGDSGPYLQYTYARCKSVLKKSGEYVIASLTSARRGDPIGIASPFSRLAGSSLAMTLNPEERLLARQLIYFSEIVAAAAANYAPNTLCRYLFELAQLFNTFYAKHPILVHSSQFTVHSKAQSVLSVNREPITHNQTTLRLALTSATAHVLKHGLYLLGIEVLEEM